jgi:two-component system, NarL family, nitrate/nitrite response regulator NarL
MADLRILVIADDPLTRAGLATLLAEQPGCTVVGRASGTDDLPAMVDICRPDALVWDMGWHPDLAVGRLSELIESIPPVAVLLSDESRVAEIWSAGAQAILRRDADPAQIAAALPALMQGLSVVDGAFAAALARPTTLSTPVPWADLESERLVEELTPRELAVLRLVAEGLPNKTIALRLGISEHTVKFHVNAILGKLGVSSRTEAVVRATRLGLILL